MTAASRDNGANARRARRQARDARNAEAARARRYLRIQEGLDRRVDELASAFRGRQGAA